MPRAMPSANAANRLMEHYLGTARRLPWRVPPGGHAPDPYRVWLSEVMLQQTTAAAVAPRFERFVRRWPSVADLAAARDEEVLSEWAGLGYYARARNLIACARTVVQMGTFPQNAVGLRQLPGVGVYTAAAVAAIAFGEPVVAVDTNVRRVAARLFALPNPSTHEVKARLAPMLPPDTPGDFTQALMDLGATICRPTAPLCTQCPLAPDCLAFAGGAPTQYPAAKAKLPKPERHGIAYWIERDGKIWLTRRPARGMLGGMSALPGPDWQSQPSDSRERALCRIRHVFTHFELTLEIVARADPQGEGWWQPIDELAGAGLPTLYRKAADAVLSARGLKAAA